MKIWVGKNNGRRLAKKPPTQFSKKVCLFGMGVVMFAIMMNFVLSWNHRETLSDVAIAVIGTFGGFVTTGYFALEGARNCSLNKHGIVIDDYNYTKTYMDKPENDHSDAVG